MWGLEATVMTLASTPSEMGTIGGEHTSHVI